MKSKNVLPVALSAPLSGLRVIEASAGTGKTWTITWLCLRLVVEKGLTIERILVVTFTRAATGELRERVRRRLQDVLDRLEGRAVEEPEVTAYVEGLADGELAHARVTAALRGFDDASIYTIHGFCQRVLADRAFSSHMPFETEILPEVGETIAGIVADFWRREVASPAPGQAGALPGAVHALFADWLIQGDVTPDALAEWVRWLLSKHGLTTRLPERELDLAGPARELETGWLALREQWGAERGAIVAILTDDPSLDRRTYGKRYIDGWAKQLDEYLLGDTFGWELPEKFDRFTTTLITSAAKKGPPPEHPFFAAAESFKGTLEAVVAGFDWRLRRLRADLLERVRAELPARLSRQRVQSYDDLLQNLAHALAGPKGGTLARALEERYPAALIDEFQDTDPLQYAIFRRIHVEGSGPETAIFLVGDPKQAIYSFRGADLFAYLAATKACAERLPLDRNQRSVPDLVAGLNALFQASDHPFLLEDVGYPEAKAAEKPRDALVEAGARDAAPLRFFLCVSEGKAAGKEKSRDWAADVAAREIARLLAAAAAGDIRLGERPLAAGDIAVLVGTHRQARQVKEALLGRDIASAERSQASVFHTSEAEQLERLLLACAEPRHENRVRAALVTNLLGLSAGDLAGLAADEPAWERRLQRFHQYHESWGREGFVRMFRRLLLLEGVVERLARYRDGERRLTNLFQLVELLHSEAARLHGPEALIHWLASRRREGAESEEAQLRLESDENLVQIVTIHSAKGLEYPVTFVPFLWDASSHVDPYEGVVFHERGNDAGPVLDLMPEEGGDAMRLAEEEEQAERLRVAYVALTRARNRCYVFWGRINKAENSALAWLLHGGVVPEDDVIRARIEELALQCKGAIRIEAQPGTAAAPVAVTPAASTLAARSLQRQVPPPWRLASFSSLAKAGLEEWRAERPDHDQAVARDEGAGAPPPAGGGRFAFPRGAEAGECLHRIFERIDFGAAAEDWLPAIRQELEQDGFAAGWTGDVAAWLREALDTPLPWVGERSPPRLAQVPAASTLRELEFHLPLSGTKLTEATALLAAHGVMVPPLGAEVLRGYLKGFIDLVFVHEGRYCLADWKSNWLGGTPEDYSRERLEEGMDRSGYRLQYLLYATALHRLLKLRVADYDYGRHFGGVYYFFVRGMHPGWQDAAGGPAGVFFIKPPLELIEGLDRIFAGRASRGLAA